MERSRPAWVLLLGFSCLSCLSWSLFFHGLGDRDLWSSHEARAAQDAQTLLTEGRWGLPHLYDGKVEMQKPPLYYWLVAAVASLRGGAVDAWAVRLPATLAALGGVLAVGCFAWRRGRPVAGLVAAAVLATALHYTWLARVGRIDMPLTLTVTLAVYGFFQAGEGPHRFGWLLLAYLAVAAGVLLKGPIGLVLPAVVLVAHGAVEGRLAAPWRLRSWLHLVQASGAGWGIPLVLAVTLPWFVWINGQTHGDFFRIFFWKHNVQRGLGGAADLASHPWWFYGPRLAFDFLPWSPLLPVAAWLVGRRGWWHADAEARFGLVWLVTVVGVLSCASFKRADYLLPAYPGAALFLGCVAERWYATVRPSRKPVLAFAGVVVGCAVGWGFYVHAVLPTHEAAREARHFAAEVRRRAPAPQLVLFFRAEAHALAFHVGPPLATLLEWENLDRWAAQPHTIYVVMPPAAARAWPRYVTAGRLEEVLRNTDLAGGRHEQPLVLLRTCPRLPGTGEPRATAPEKTTDARAAGTAPDRPGPPQHRPAGPQ